MTDLIQQPAEINILVAIDDSFSSLVDLSISLTGYTVTAFVDKLGGGSEEFTVVNTDLAAGKVTISLTSAQIASIGDGLHHWYWRYTNGTISRRAFAGTFKVIQYP